MNLAVVYEFSKHGKNFSFLRRKYISSSYITEKKSEECIHEYQISQRIRKESIGAISFSRIFCTILHVFYVYPL